MYFLPEVTEMLSEITPGLSRQYQTCIRMRQTTNTHKIQHVSAEIHNTDSGSTVQT